MLVYGSDLWEALNERLLAENTTSIFGCQVSMGYCGRGFAWNEAPVSVWKCTWDVRFCRLLKWQVFFPPSQYNRCHVKAVNYSLIESHVNLNIYGCSQEEGGALCTFLVSSFPSLCSWPSPFGSPSFVTVSLLRHETQGFGFSLSVSAHALLMSLFLSHFSFSFKLILLIVSES